jgi:two-component system sensor histidine kinase FlrB
MSRGVTAARQTSQHLFRDLILTFQSASEALEKSYRELQDRVQALTAELEQERGQRIRLERLAAMGEMAMELAHEIRNPLGSIELYASMLEGEFADQIVQSVRLLNHSVTNVLQFGRPIVPSAKPVRIGVLLDGVRAAVQPLAAQKKIRLEVVSPEECEFLADYELMHRMLLNLVLNALRETPTAGTICLEAAQNQEGQVTLMVADSGAGISQEAIARIFEPTYSTHRDGCGLGLSIVKRIAESHGGLIRVESGPAGTRFLLTFPHDMEVVSESAARC